MAGSNTFLLLYLLVLATGLCLGQDEPKDQYGDLNCQLNDDGNIEATFYILKNNSRITRAYFSYADYTEYTGADCQFSGSGVDGDPFTAKVWIDPRTDSPPAGRDDCGHTVVTSGDTYRWLIYTQRQENFHMDGNVLFIFSCNVIPTNMTISITNTGREVLDIPSTIGSLELSMVDASTASATLLTSIDIGNDYFPRLRFQPSPTLNSTNIDQDLYPWGAYCERLYVSPNDNPNRRVQLLAATGCPNPGVGLDAGFVGTKPPFGQIFLAFAGPQEAWRFDKTADYPTDVSDTLLFTCEARLCWRPDDTQCLNRCPPARRKRRSLTSDSERTYVIATKLTITQEETPGKQGSKDDDLHTTIYITAGVGGVVLLSLIAITICCLRRRRRQNTSSYRQRLENTSITSSTNSSRSSKTGRIEPRFTYPRKY